MGTSPPFYTKGEEIFNSVSHGVGSLFAIIGTAVMITLAACFGNWVAVVSSAVYGLSLIAMFTMSTLYHAIPFDKVKRVMRILDHSCIYLLIAGTYTPITLIVLRESRRGAAIFIFVWILTIIGIVLNAIDINRFRRVSLFLYVGMGWAVLYDLSTVIERLGTGGFVLLLVGGISYTVGIIFYKLKKIRYMHGVWHLFVLAGSVLHYLCVLLYVLPL